MSGCCFQLAATVGGAPEEIHAAAVTGTASVLTAAREPVGVAEGLARTAAWPSQPQP